MVTYEKSFKLKAHAIEKIVKYQRLVLHSLTRSPNFEFRVPFHAEI